MSSSSLLSTSIIETPNESDILCGKDKTYSKHPGNQIYRAVISEKASLYMETSNKQDKMSMTKQIVAQMQQAGRRFLRALPGGEWEEISNQQSRDKTSHALRFCAASLQKKNKSRGSASKTAIHQQQTKTKTKRSHRRTVSRDTTTTRTTTTTSTSHHKRVVSKEDVIFQRQQAILHASYYETIDDNACGSLVVPAIITSSSAASVVASEQPEQHEPVPLHCSSEDLDLILQEPLTTQDWDGLFVLT